MSKQKKEHTKPCDEDEIKEEENAEADDKQQDDELEKLKQEVKNKQDSYMRLAAEYENYRKRTTAEKANIYADATAKAISEILPVADSLDMALKSVENAPEEYKKGLELVCNQIGEALKKLNVEAFGETGETFNPDLHNAVSKIEDDSLGENVLAQVFQRGYKTGDKIIRHAMVQVANCD